MSENVKLPREVVDLCMRCGGPIFSDESLYFVQGERGPHCRRCDTAGPSAPGDVGMSFFGHRLLIEERTRLRAELEQMKNKECVWTMDHDAEELMSSCGDAFAIPECDWKAAKITFCPSCGGRVKVIDKPEEATR